jgi:hypothetical protein
MYSIVCYPPEIELFPDATSLKSPAQFRRLQDFYISSNIRITCAASSSFRTQWTIYNCTDSREDPIQVSSSILTKYSEIFIPSRTLDFGMYKFQLTVTMNYSANYSQSQSTYVKITYSNITANLIQYGTSVITSGHLKNLTMNPGKHSVDPDKELASLNSTVRKK